jgi:dihydroorotase
MPFFMSKMNNKLILKNGQLTDGSICNIFIEDERIIYLGDKLFPNTREIDCTGKYIIPGIIDAHTHIRDMRLTYKEDWLSASKAAASAGITTVFDMPNTKPATFDIESLQTKRNAAQKSIVNYGYNFGVTEYNSEQILQANPIASIKMFMAESSSGYVVEREDVIRRVFKVAKEIDKPVMVHAELQSCVEEYEKKFEATIHNHNKIRNPICAVKATELLIRLAEETGAKVYLAHISLREEIEMIRAAKKRGAKNLFCEVTPHHLFINESILGQVGNYGKVNPPIRTADDNKAIEEAILDGTVDTIGTDHAPHGLDEKKKEYSSAPSGFPGLETSLGLMMQLVHSNKISMQKLTELMSTRPAEIFKIKDRGHLKVGAYADIAIVDLNKEWIVTPEEFYTKAKYSPFSGMKLKGKVTTTIINGKIVWHNNQLKETRGKEIEFS